MRLYIQQNRPKTLDEAVQISIEIEAFQKADKQRPAVRKFIRGVETAEYRVEEVAVNKANTSSIPNDESYQSLKAEIEELKKMVKQLSIRQKEKHCYKCKQQGHFAYNCPLNKKTANTNNKTLN